MIRESAKPRRLKNPSLTRLANGWEIRCDNEKSRYVTLKSGACNTKGAKHLEKVLYVVYICTGFLKKHDFDMKLDIQLLTAAVLSIGGLVLLFIGTFITPPGQIHEVLRLCLTKRSRRRVRHCEER